MIQVAATIAPFHERFAVHSCPSLSHLRFEAAASLRNSLEAKIDLWPVRGGKRASVGSPETTGTSSALITAHRGIVRRGQSCKQF
jgi:hypothetical protein